MGAQRKHSNSVGRAFQAEVERELCLVGSGTSRQPVWPLSAFATSLSPPVKSYPSNVMRLFSLSLSFLFWIEGLFHP